MHIVIRCKECNHKISWPVEKPFIMERCPNCDVMFSADTDLIDGMADKIHNGVARLNHVAIEGIYAGDEEARIRRESKASAFEADLNSLGIVYQNASAETQEFLLGIIDTMYLLVNTDAQKANVANLEQTYRQVQDLWRKKMDSREIIL